MRWRPQAPVAPPPTPPEEGSFLEGADAVDVVDRVLRAELPLRLLVHRTKQIQLDDDAAFTRLCDEVLQTFEITLVPFREIEFVPAVRVTGSITPGPRADETTG